MNYSKEKIQSIRIDTKKTLFQKNQLNCRIDGSVPLFRATSMF